MKTKIWYERKQYFDFVLTQENYFEELKIIIDRLNELEINQFLNATLHQRE